MTGEINWHPEVFIAAVGTHIKNALDKSAVFIRDYAVRSFDFAKSGKPVPATQGKGRWPGRRGNPLRQMTPTSRNWQYVTRSAPGEPPAVQKGWLSEHVTWDAPDPLERRIGVTRDVRYAMALEFGTSDMAARPYLRPALYTCLDQVRDFFNEKIE